MTGRPPARYHYWLDRTERRLRCPAGHEFTPDMRLTVGRADVTCKHGDGSAVPCDRLLLVLVVPSYPKRLVAEVSRYDLDHMATEEMQPATELAYLLSTPVRRSRTEAA